MNNAPLNSVAINAEPFDAVQRVAILLQAVAAVVLGPRVHARGVVTSEPAASISLVARALARAPVVVQASAVTIYGGLERIYGVVSVVARAVVSATATVYARNYVSEAVTAIGRAIMAVTPRFVGRLVTTTTAQATATISTANCYSFVPGVVTVNASADVDINFDTYKRLPFDENATEDRTMQVPEDNRVMTAI